MAISVVSFLFSRAAQPEARGPTLLGAGFLYRILSLTGLVSKLTDFLSSASNIIVQSPTQYLPITGHQDVSLPLSLEWHVWLSSSGNNCHAVHKSISSGASVCDCTVQFYHVPFVSQAHLRQWNMHLPHLWNGMFGRVEGQYTTFINWMILNNRYKQRDIYIYIYILREREREIDEFLLFIWMNLVELMLLKLKFL